jgi:hypothetical protein
MNMKRALTPDSPWSPPLLPACVESAQTGMLKSKGDSDSLDQSSSTLYGRQRSVAIVAIVSRLDSLVLGLSVSS